MTSPEEMDCSSYDANTYQITENLYFSMVFPFLSAN